VYSGRLAHDGRAIKKREPTSPSSESGTSSVSVSMPSTNLIRSVANLVIPYSAARAGAVAAGILARAREKKRQTNRYQPARSSRASQKTQVEPSPGSTKLPRLVMLDASNVGISVQPFAPLGDPEHLGRLLLLGGRREGSAEERRSRDGVGVEPFDNVAVECLESGSGSARESTEARTSERSRNLLIASTARVQDLAEPQQPLPNIDKHP
jgi:hypothetical protein